MSQGFHYTLDSEQIAEYIKLAPEQKLQWLEDILIFTEAALSAEDKKIRDYFRNENGRDSDSV